MAQQKKRKIYFTIIFIIIGLLAFQVSLSRIIGSNIKFTLFDAFGPITSAFLGTIPGIIALFFIQFFNLLIHGVKALDAATIIRFFPVMFAAWYFAKPRRINILIPILAIIAFNLHPIGRSAWYYSMYWLIPIFCEFLRERFLLARALGATFTAHAVGSTAWLWMFGLSKAVWTGLIPIVAMERGMFAVGICITYLAVNNILAVLDDKKVVDTKNFVNPKFVWNKLLSHKA